MPMMPHQPGRPRVRTTREQQTLFAYAPGAVMTDGVPVLTVLIPQAAWEYMQDGLSHDFDLTKIGVPIKLVIGRCQDHVDGMAILEQVNGGKMKDIRAVDVGFYPKTPPKTS